MDRLTEAASQAAATMVNREACRLASLSLGIPLHRALERLGNMSDAATELLYFDINHSGISIDLELIAAARKGYERDQVVSKQARPLAEIYTKHLRR